MVLNILTSTKNTRKKISKSLFFFFICILLIGMGSSIRINEVEMNPAEGKEWVELYNEDDEDINITKWEIWEGISGSSGPKKIKNFSEETILGAGEFYVIEFNNKLNNGGDFVILYNNSIKRIDETPLLDESKNSSKTYQLCNSNWKFLESTKGTENNCVEEDGEEDGEEQPENTIESENQTQEETPSEEEKIGEEDIEEGTSEKETITPSLIKEEIKTVNLTPIMLNSPNSKDIKSEDNKEILKRNLSFYGIITFGIVLGALLLLNKRKNKNEFRQ